jgi:hypothetical protein
MNEDTNANEQVCRDCWINCGVQPDDEMLDIDRMEDAIAPLDEQTVRIRELITRFESCYHQADRQAELIAGAIGDGRCPEESNERPAERKKELVNSRLILSCWCEDPSIRGMNLDVGGIRAEELLSYIGKADPLKIWQVERVVNKIGSALEPDLPYHNLALDLGDYGESLEDSAGGFYKNNAAFLEKTKAAVIHDTVDGQKAKISLATAIDLLMPCHWDFAGALEIVLQAIGGGLSPRRPYACCARNLKLSPLYGRLETISNTLGVFWRGEKLDEGTDLDILASLGQVTDVKRWLAASMDKTMRLQLYAPSDFWLQFS